MGLSSCMWTGVTGLTAHGDRMNVIGNNIANVNTVGFKSQRMDFADFIYQDAFSLAGTAQIGRGTRIGAVMGDFQQGTFENSSETTDLAIGGNGFFCVQPIGSDTSYYTRAGNFRFNADGYLVDPNGYCVQGWKVDNSTSSNRPTNGTSAGLDYSASGLTTDVRIDTWTVNPMQTANVSMMLNLSSDKGADKARDASQPFASLLNIWDGTQPQQNNVPYIPEDSYSYQTSIEVYDEAGGTHTLTVYFDQVSSEDYVGTNSESMWEYIVTMDPSEDARQVAVPRDPAAYATDPANYAGEFDVVDMKETSYAGMLMSGTLTFDSGGTLSDMSAYVLNGSTEPATDAQGNLLGGNGYYIHTSPADGSLSPVPVLDPERAADFMYPTEVSPSGFPLLVANFTGVDGAHTVGSVPNADQYLMEINFGLKISDYSVPWENNNSLGSLEYALLENPMVNQVDPDDPTTWTGLNNPASDEADPETLPYPSRELTFSDAVNDGTGTYIYENPDYNASVVGSPPYVYTDQGTLDAAWETARANAATRLGVGVDELVLTDVRKADWPMDTALPAATPLSSSTRLATISSPVEVQNNAFTSYKGSFMTHSISQDGYGFGNLSNYSVDTDGVLYGVYSNGVTLPLYQLTLHDFPCKQGLRREGNNLFSESPDSGSPSSGVAGTGTFGTVNANSLEGSNVDLSTEFVRMITTQRGFQANSKIVTTTDTMLETVINMKRM